MACNRHFCLIMSTSMRSSPHKLKKLQQLILSTLCIVWALFEIFSRFLASWILLIDWFLLCLYFGFLGFGPCFLFSVFFLNLHFVPNFGHLARCIIVVLFFGRRVFSVRTGLYYYSRPVSMIFCSLLLSCQTIFKVGWRSSMSLLPSVQLSFLVLSKVSLLLSISLYL